MRIIKLLFIGIMIVLLSCVARVYGYSEYLLQQNEQSKSFQLTLTANEAVLQQGKHLARTRGCFGCHGQQLQGRVFTDQWDWVKRAVAPNLVTFANRHDAGVLEQAIRQGIGADGRALWSMPSYNFTRLSDDDISAMILYFQSAPVVQQNLPEPAMGLSARWWLISGQIPHMQQMVQEVPELKFSASEDISLKKGEYMAMTTCNECHGLDLQGEEFSDMSTPSLAALIKAYNEADFRRLMKQGISTDNRDDLGLMTRVAKDRFAYFTDDELSDLYGFLSQLEIVPKAPK